jgi:hypothetical protein
MNRPAEYERWKHRRCQITPPSDFADRVMQSLDESPDPVQVSNRRPSLSSFLWQSCIAASIAVACVGVGLLRVQAFVVLVLSGPF